MIPLVLDLDGTLVCTDTLAEGLLRLLAERPSALLRLRGPIPMLKQRVAAWAPVVAAGLVYNEQVLALARQARAEGRPVFLATAADQLVADAVAAHLGLFDGVLASDGRTNVKGVAKAAALVARFGAGQFDYVGDSTADLPVWRVARRAYLVAPRAALRAAAHAVCADVRCLGTAPGRGARWRLILRAMRPHQWAKNMLVFVPVLAAHRAQGGVLLVASLAFLAFGCCASAVYVINDLLDLPHDRAHPAKRRRPFASGRLAPARAPLLVACLLLAAGSSALVLPWRFMAVLAFYLALTSAYSLALKRHMVWDIVTLAGLYTLRLFAGAAATGIRLSPWLLAFALFFFFCLAIVKRLTELIRFARDAPGAALSGRGYGPADLDMLRAMATASGYMAVLVLALYVNSADVLMLYRMPRVLWALCPILLFWVSRVLILANRGQLDDDPVVFALRDRVSLLSGAACLGVLMAATF